jgi:hypothetical protein
MAFQAEDVIFELLGVLISIPITSKPNTHTLETSLALLVPLC